MPDLFSAPQRPNPKAVGHGNALLLADIAARLPLQTITANRKAGKYGQVWRHAGQWLRFAGYRL